MSRVSWHAGLTQTWCSAVNYAYARLGRCEKCLRHPLLKMHWFGWGTCWCQEGPGQGRAQGRVPEELQKWRTWTVGVENCFERRAYKRTRI